jgi:hypothetical protein
VANIDKGKTMDRLSPEWSPVVSHASESCENRVTMVKTFNPSHCYSKVITMQSKDTPASRTLGLR